MLFLYFGRQIGGFIMFVSERIYMAHSAQETQFCLEALYNHTTCMHGSLSDICLPYTVHPILWKVTLAILRPDWQLVYTSPRPAESLIRLSKSHFKNLFAKVWLGLNLHKDLQRRCDIRWIASKYVLAWKYYRKQFKFNFVHFL